MSQLYLLIHRARACHFLLVLFLIAEQVQMLNSAWMMQASQVMASVDIGCKAGTAEISNATNKTLQDRVQSSN